MEFFTQDSIRAALARLGELADERGKTVKLFVVGGANLLLQHANRPSTKDIDAVFLAPVPISEVRELARLVADDLGLPPDWLNDGVKGYVGSHVAGAVIFAGPGICVTGAPPAQMLALKLSAWRDDVDMGDAEVLLLALRVPSREIAWEAVQPYLDPPNCLKASYALHQLWESIQ